jgi:exonuclease III
MKLISLNIWWGKYSEALMRFIREQKDSTDIFCFQEVYSSKDRTEYSIDYQPNIFEILERELADFNSFFVDDVHGLDPHVNPVDFDLRYGNAVFIRKSLIIKRQFYKFIFREGSSNIVKHDSSDEPRVLLVSEIEKEGILLNIANYHGQSAPPEKLDTAERIKHSQKILEVLKKCQGEIILCGDFNLMPETESVKVIENSGFRNLIREFNVKGTRGSLNPYVGTPKEQRFADYTFVSSGLKVKSFSVPDAKVSDHCPMILEFEV